MCTWTAGEACASSMGGRRQRGASQVRRQPSPLQWCRDQSPAQIPSPAPAHLLIITLLDQDPTTSKTNLISEPWRALGTVKILQSGRSTQQELLQSGWSWEQNTFGCWALATDILLHEKRPVWSLIHCIKIKIINKHTIGGVCYKAMSIA